MELNCFPFHKFWLERLDTKSVECWSTIEKHIFPFDDFIKTGVKKAHYPLCTGMDEQGCLQGYEIIQALDYADFDKRKRDRLKIDKEVTHGS